MSDFTVAVLTDRGGAHLEAYFAALAAIETVTSIVVADPSGDCESQARKTLGNKLTKFGRHHQTMLRDSAPVLTVVSLEAVQAPPVIHLALEENCHVLAEKPACIDVADFAPLTQLADMKHRHLMLAMANRVRTISQSAKRLIQSGKIGQIYGCNLHLIADQTRLKNPAYHKSWFADRARAGGGHLAWLGIHGLDLIMEITNSTITHVAGFTGVVGGQPLQSEDTAAMALKFANGSMGNLTSGYFLDKGKQIQIKVWGSKGWLQLDIDGAGSLKWYSTIDGTPDEKIQEGLANESSYTPFVQSCVNACIDPQFQPPITTSQSLQVLKTVFACYQAAELNQTQTIL